MLETVASRNPPVRGVNDQRRTLVLSQNEILGMICLLNGSISKMTSLLADHSKAWGGAKA